MSLRSQGPATNLQVRDDLGGDSRQLCFQSFNQCFWISDTGGFEPEPRNMRQHAEIGKSQPPWDQGCGIANNQLTDQVWRWKACLRKAGNQASTNVGTGYGRNESGSHGGDDLIIESHARKRIQPFLIGNNLVESEDTPRSDR